MYFKLRAHLVRNLMMVAVLTMISQQALLAQPDWRMYGGAAGNTRASTLNQITPANVRTLQQIWTWDSGEKTFAFETMPLVVDHVMYATAPDQRVVALDADTGKEIWSFDPKAASPKSNRGVTYWPGDGQNAARLILGTSEGRIYALDVKTGKPIPSFGDGGVVDYRATFSATYPNAMYGFSSPPALYKDLIIFGPRTAEFGPKGPAARGARARCTHGQRGLGIPYLAASRRARV